MDTAKPYAVWHFEIPVKWTGHKLSEAVAGLQEVDFLLEPSPEGVLLTVYSIESCFDRHQGHERPNWAVEAVHLGEVCRLDPPEEAEP